MADIMEDLVVADILETCQGITTAAGYHINVVKTTQDDFDILDIPISMCPMVLLRQFKTSPAGNPGLGRREVRARIILSVVLKQHKAHLLIYRAQRDVEDALMVDRHRGQDSAVNTAWVSSDPYVFQSDNIAWSNVELLVYWSEVRS